MPTPKRYESAKERQAAYRLRCKARAGAAPVAPSTPGPRRWEMMRRQALSLVETVAQEMETYHDQRSEQWRDSERAEAFAETLESLADIATALRDIPSH
jgi:hypothetical protein